MSYAIGSAAPHSRLTDIRRPSLWARIAGMAAVVRSRRDLRDLDAHQLDDIGLSRTAAQSEARRVPWDVPQHWLSGH